MYYTNFLHVVPCIHPLFTIKTNKFSILTLLIMLVEHAC